MVNVQYPISWIIQAKNKIRNNLYSIYLNKPNFSFQGLYFHKYKVIDIGDSSSHRCQYYIQFFVHSESSCYIQPDNICKIASDFEGKISSVDSNVITQFHSFMLVQKDNEYIGEFVIKLIVGFSNIEKSINRDK